jgi:hypothetical protein
MQNINYLQGSSTLRALKLNHSLSMEPHSTQDATKPVTQILDSKYKKADLQSIVRDNCKHLSADQQKKLLQLLKNYKMLFDGTLGDWKTCAKFPIHDCLLPASHAQCCGDRSHCLNLGKLRLLGIFMVCTLSLWSSIENLDVPSLPCMSNPLPIPSNFPLSLARQRSLKRWGHWPCIGMHGCRSQ